MHYTPISNTDHTQVEPPETAILQAHNQQSDSTLPRRLGLWSVSVLIAGTILILGVVGFLIFLWSDPRENTVWRRIVIASWMTRSITLSGLAIRGAVSAQAAVMTSMLAAIALSRAEVLLPDLAAVSITRYAASGPQNLLLSLSGAFYRRKGITVWLLAAILSVTTASLQFTSTILLSDLSVRMIHDIPVTALVNAAWNSSVFRDFDFAPGTSSLLLRNPTIYPTFAEYRENPYYDNYIYDTGPSFRGLLPIQATTSRGVLRNYSGPATVLDTRTICVKPQVLGYPNISFIDMPSSLGNIYIGVRGVIGLAPEMKANQYIRDQAWTGFFNCTVPLPVYDSIVDHVDDDYNTYAAEEEWPVAICPIETLGDKPVKLPLGIFSYTTNYWSTYLVLNSTGSYGSWQYALVGKRQNMTLHATSGDSDGEWAKWGLSKWTPAMLSMSLCFYAHDSKDIAITASSTENHTEADIGWSGEKEWYDTTDIRRSLGLASDVSDGPPQGYGHLQMMKPTAEALNTTFRPLGYGGNELVMTWAVERDMIQNQNTSIYMCSKCFHYDFNSDPKYIQEVHPLLAAIINDVFRYTRRPALALQTLFTILTAMPYYDQLPGFDGKADATSTVFVERLMPTSRPGLIAVLIVLALHLLLLALVVILFIFTAGRTVTGYIGSSWLAVSQVATDPAVRGWVSTSTARSDQAMHAYLRRAGRDKEVVSILGKER